MNFLLQRKVWAETVRDAWLSGCGGGTTVGPGGKFQDGPVALYGVTPETMSLWVGLRREHRDYYYIDNAYFSAGHADDKYLRVTKNARQCSGFGKSDGSRVLKHNVNIRPWRGGGECVLVTCQSEWWYVQHGTTLQHWIDAVISEIKQYSDRPIRIRLKPKSKYLRAPNHVEPGEITAANADVPFERDLKDAWALVTHSSNTAVEAIIEGVPAFVTDSCAAKPMACSDLAFIESPRRPDGREQWTAVLAANQWTLDEIRSGKCWADLNPT